MSNLILLAQTLNQCINRSGSGECETNLPRVNATASQIEIIVRIGFGIIGVIAVVVIMIAGLKLMTSNGDPQALGKARSTLIYAVVGLIIAVSAELIVSLLVSNT